MRIQPYTQGGFFPFCSKIIFSTEKTKNKSKNTKQDGRQNITRFEGFGFSLVLQKPKVGGVFANMLVQFLNRRKKRNAAKK